MQVSNNPRGIIKMLHVHRCCRFCDGCSPHIVNIRKSTNAQHFSANREILNLSPFGSRAKRGLVLRMQELEVGCEMWGSFCCYGYLCRGKGVTRIKKEFARTSSKVSGIA